MGDGELWFRRRKQDRGQQISVWTHVVKEVEVGDTEEKVMTLLQLSSACIARKKYAAFYLFCNPLLWSPLNNPVSLTRLLPFKMCCAGLRSVLVHCLVQTLYESY